MTDLFDATDWSAAFDPLMALYSQRKHPLDYRNHYQLAVMVILSAQDSDKHINALAPALFLAYPSFAQLAKAAPEDLFPYIDTIRNFSNKAQWLVKTARKVYEEGLPSTMAELTKLSGIGRKSANVIIRESGGLAEGVIVDLHVVRVAPRLGVAIGNQPEKIEKQLMATVPRAKWGELGMAISFLGREVCRPTNPKCEICVLNPVCAHYNKRI